MEPIFVIFFLLLLYKIKFGVNDDFLSKDYTGAFRGICALIIVLVHIRRVPSVPLFNLVQYLANPVVGVFFFLSGYGIVTRIKQVGTDSYMHGYLKKRVVPLFVEYAFVWLFYCLCMFCVNRNFGFLKESFIPPHSWFIIVILAIYLLVFVGCKIFKFNVKNLIIFITVVSFVTVILLSALGADDYWYDTLLGFSFGMVFKYVDVKKEKTLPVIVVSAVCTVAFFVCQHLLKNTDFVTVRMVIYNLFVGSAAIVALNMGRYVRFNNPIFKSLGKVSLEIYLLHGVFQYMFAEIPAINNNNLLYGAVVISCTILCSYAFYAVKKRVLNNKTER